MTVKELKKGTYFTLKPIDEPLSNQVWIRGDYDKESKTYSCINFDDICYERFFKGNKTVYTDFVF